MDFKENEDIISINADAPPVPIIPNQHNNNINNINNINLNRTNLNIYPNIQNNNQININRSYNQINLGGNNQIQAPNLYNNNPYFYNNYHKNMLNLNNINYYNNLQMMNDINYNNNNNSYEHNTKNPISFNKNINNKKNINNIYDTDLCNLIIKIEPDLLKKLGRNYLIDIILFLTDFCKIKIPIESTRLKHEIFNINQIGQFGNNYKFYIRANIKDKLNLLKGNKTIEKIDDLLDNNEININNDDCENNINIINNINNNENIIDENKINNEKNENKISNKFICDIHNKSFISKDELEAHFKTHIKCQICGMEFKYKNGLKKHRKTHSLNNNSNKNEKIKCTECDLMFDSIESMSEHFYKIHENNKKDKFDKNEEPKQDEKIEIKKEENIKQTEIKINEEKDNINNNIQFKNNYDEKDEPKIKASKNIRIFQYDEDNYDNLKKYNVDDYPYFCAICKKGFFNEISYQRHINKHV